MFIESGAGPPGIDRDIDMVLSALEELHDLASDRQKAQDGARVYDFSTRWGVLLSGRLRRLDHYHRAKELTPDQERRYVALREALRNVTPQAERLGVARPAPSPDDQGPGGETPKGTEAGTMDARRQGGGSE